MDTNSPHRTAHRLALATIANLAGQTLVVVSVIIITPIIVHAVGTTDYGVWVLFGSVASFGFLLELGISAALVKYVAEHAARDEVDEAAAMIGAATWLYALLGGLVVVLGVALGLLVPLVLTLHGAFARLATPLAILVALNLGVSMVAVTPVAVLRGLQRYPAANAITGGGAALSALGIGLALLLGTGIIGVGAAAALSSLITYVISIGIVRRVAPGFTRVLIRADRERARRLLRFSRSVAVVQVAIQLQTRLDAVVIAAALPIRLLSPYNFAQQLSTGIGTVTEQFGKVLLPLATQMGATEHRARLRELFVASTRITLLIALAVGLPVALLGGSILRIWVGPRFSGYGEVVALLAVATVIDLTSYSAAALLQSIERHGPIARMALAGGVLNLCVSVALVFPLGIDGVALATLIATTAEMALLVLPYTGRILGVSAERFISQVLLRLVPAGLAYATALLILSSVVSVTTLPALVLVVGAGLIVYTVVYFCFGAAAGERDAFRTLASTARRSTARGRGGTPTSAP